MDPFSNLQRLLGEQQKNYKLALFLQSVENTTTNRFHITF